MKTLVMLPTYNERENLPIVVDRILSLGLGLHVLVVDDDSPDGTWRLAEAIAREHPEVHVLRRTTLRGRGYAGVAGFKWGVERGYDVLIEMDADLSHDPQHIPDMLAAIEGHDVVIGSRHVEGGGEAGRGLARRFITRFARRYMQTVLGVHHVQYCTSGYRAFRREALEAIDLDTLESPGPSIVTEILFRCRNMRIQEVPIQFVDRLHGESKFGFRAIRDSFWVPVKVRLRAARGGHG